MSERRTRSACAFFCEGHGLLASLAFGLLRQFRACPRVASTTLQRLHAPDAAVPATPVTSTHSRTCLRRARFLSGHIVVTSRRPGQRACSESDKYWKVVTRSLLPERRPERRRAFNLKLTLCSGFLTVVTLVDVCTEVCQPRVCGNTSNVCASHTYR